MKKLILLFLFGFNSLIYSQTTPPEKPPKLSDTLQAFVASSASWYKSSETDFSNCNVFPWPGARQLPATPTYSSLVEVGQPYGFVSIPSVVGAQPIKSSSGVNFFRTTFWVDSLAVITDCRFQRYVDDDIEIYINRQLIAREQDGQPINYNGAQHDLVLYDFGPAANGYDGGARFDYVSIVDINQVVHQGENELVLAVRNKKGDAGGFSFNMNYSYVVDPVWVGLAEHQQSQKPFMEVYPNPASDYVYLNPTLDNIHPYTVALYNTTGKLVYKEIRKGPYLLNLNARPSGLYLLQINQNHLQQNFKIQHP